VRCLLQSAAKSDDSRKVKERESETARLKELVAELLLDKRMFQDVAKKMVTAAQQRACAAYLQETHLISERMASQVLGRSRSTLRYRAAAGQRDLPLVKAIKRLARKHPRWGYRRSHARLEPRAGR
jgi:hypothetical protein